MKRLYWKIFFSFWLVMILVIATNLVVTWIQATRFHNSEDSAEQIAELAQQAIDSYEQGSTEGFWRWRDGLKRETRLRVILINSQGDDVTGRPLPHFFRALIKNGGKPAATESSEHWLPKSEHSWFSPKPLKRHGPPILWPGIGDSGERYHLILLNPRQLSDHLYGRSAIFWRIGISILVVALFAMLLSHYMVKPIRVLQQASRSLAEGNLDSRVREAMGKRRDELGQLGDDFDTMADRLQSLILDQRRMLRDVSHELRTPLARLRIALALARKRGGADKELDRIELESERIDELIGDILQLVRLNNSLDGIERKPTALQPLLQALVDDANLVDARVSLDCAPHIWLLADAKLLRRALENIVQNALKYSDTQVEVKAEAQQGQGAGTVCIHVSDCGPGVEDSQLAQLFEPFFRSDDARQRDTGGYGLGLAIAARSITVQQGRIHAHNRPQGGLRITLELPPAAPPSNAGETG